LSDSRCDPEAVDANRDYGEEEPLDPEAEKAEPGSGEDHLLALDE
jgi:hypothetical protein